MEKIKGVTHCNRTACQVELVDGTTYYNQSTEANYCPHCAYLINKHNPKLCILDTSKVTDIQKYTGVIHRLEDIIKGMHPVDGLTSPRDIMLVTEINRLNSMIEDIKKHSN